MLYQYEQQLDYNYGSGTKLEIPDHDLDAETNRQTVGSTST